MDAGLTAVQGDTRLEQLRALAALLAGSIDSCDDPRALPALARQYRETIREIEGIEGADNAGDEIGAILNERGAHGKSGADRKGRAGIQKLGRGRRAAAAPNRRDGA